MMKKNGMKQIAFTSLFIGVNSLGFADSPEIAHYDSLAKIAANDNSSQKMNQQPPRDQMNQMGPSLGDKNPPYPNPNRFVFEGSFIYWQADVDGIDDVLSVNLSAFVEVNPLSVAANQTFKDKTLEFKWDPGFKAAIGTIFGDRDEWDLILRWTWLRSKAHKTNTAEVNPNLSIYATEQSVGPNIGANESFFLVPQFSPTLLASPANFSKTRWQLNYNTIDLELGRNFFLAKNLTLRPHLGLRGALLHQRTKSNFTVGSQPVYLDPGENFINIGSISGTTSFDAKNDYNAIGLRGGLDTRWNFTNHFCVYGGVSGAILYGEFKIDEDYAQETIVVQPGPISIGPTSILALFDNGLNLNFHRTRSTLQAALGLMWHTGFNDDKNHISIGAEYEVNQWFQQNELRTIQGTGPNYIALRSPGDLGLHGVTVDVIFDF